VWMMVGDLELRGGNGLLGLGEGLVGIIIYMFTNCLGLLF
jgi:hypothetical protein